MDSVAVTVPLRPPTKKMKKRKELDALAPPHAISRRSSGKRSSQELLTDSSDERSEYWNVSTSRGSGGGGGGGSRKSRRGDSARGPCRGLMRACSVFLGGTVVLVTAVLIWLFIDVRQQLTALRAELDQVIAGSRNLPDALQTCHTLDKNLKNNVTYFNGEIDKLHKSLDTFSGQISNLQEELKQVQVSLKSAPELTSVPSTVKALQESIGLLENDIHDLQTTYKMLQEGTVSLQHYQVDQGKNLTRIENILSGLSNTTQQPQTMPSNETLVETHKLWDAISDLSKNLTHINQTLTMNITWALEDLANDHKKVVSLQDMAQNASTQILTLQQECSKKKDQEALQNLFNTLSTRIDKLSNSRSNYDRADQVYSAAPNSSDPLLSSFQDLNKPLDQRNLHAAEVTTKASHKTSDVREDSPSEASTADKQLFHNKN